MTHERGCHGWHEAGPCFGRSLSVRGTLRRCCALAARPGPPARLARPSHVRPVMRVPASGGELSDRGWTVL